MCKLVAIKTNFNDEVLVADIKKKHIENIINAAPTCSKIAEIILFGSSLEERCSEESDIDIAIISEDNVSKLSSNKAFREFMNKIYKADWGQEYDRLYFKSVEQIKKNKDKAFICEEIENKGKTIYRRDV